jgi:hypothetical protein
LDQHKEYQEGGRGWKVAGKVRDVIDKNADGKLMKS